MTTNAMLSNEILIDFIIMITLNLFLWVITFVLILGRTEEIKRHCGRNTQSEGEDQKEYST